MGVSIRDELKTEEVWFDPQNSKLFLAFFILVLVAIAD
jgi:hypothetical protein